ncbi:isoaspartyl peptidase/L-asparaginase family protein [Aurantiacibacter suaedae]|uniref:isoaspartyl peptidase/L-asparaginase family protein n=1 Tax=Aurantiacibacter suaedae TaxID=2545755 RepID=UPI001F4F653E|nr:isoaspartyl peptidase/L-asparaginase [Aurantiacibacter suaedae]
MTTLPASHMPPTPEWTLVIHGGAGTILRPDLSPEREERTRAALARALADGSAILESGGGALDAVQAAVQALENDPAFNAGHGAVFTAEGTIELDSAIMEGTQRRAGAVCGVTRTRSPVSLARKVLDDGRYVLLASAGADRFSLERGLEQAEPDYFATDRARAQLARWHEREAAGLPHINDEKHGTVGAVARDKSGALAAATSTGGHTGKRFGRVGDSPLIGAGTYADDRACAVSATGAGEFYIREGLAHEIAARMRFLGESAQEAADAVQAETLALGGTGGVIVVGADGTPAWSFNTEGMYRGVAAAGAEPVVAMYGDE